MRDATWHPLSQGTDLLQRWKRARRVRLAHDLFDLRINSETIRPAWDAMWAAKDHRFLVTTIHPKRLRTWASRNASARRFGWIDFDRQPTMHPGDVIHMDELYYRGRCGWVDYGGDRNNGYGCAHPENEENGECHTFACPIAYSAGLCANCDAHEDDCTCGDFYEDEDLMELHSRPRRAVAGNVWIGTRVSTRDEAAARIPDLMRTKGAVRYVESVPGLDLREWIRKGAELSTDRGSSHSVNWSISWVVINGVWTPTTTMDTHGRRHLPRLAS